MTAGGSPRRSGGRLAAAALGAVAVVGAGLVAVSLMQQVGDPPQPALGSGTSSEAPEEAEPVAGSGDADPEGPVRTADPSGESDMTPSAAPTAPESSAEAERPMTASEPVALSIDAIDVQEDVFPIGLGTDGELLAPSGDRADLPAWYDGSPTPGETGPSVIEGHVTWGGRPSVFFDLGALAPGDRVSVLRADGSIAEFEVYDAARYPKDSFPTLEVYGRTEGPELRLITCGGDLDADGHHLDNTVVFARLVPS